MPVQGTKSAPKPPRVRGRAVTTKTRTGTAATYIFYVCPACGAQHRVNGFGLRVLACRRSALVFVVAGGA